MNKKAVIGILFGAIAGAIDVVPMLLQKLTWDANLSAFFMWVVIGFFLSTTELKLHPVIKGLLFSFLCLLPSVFIIGWKQPSALFPIFIMTAVLGSLLGLAVGRFAK
jgi:hypothetical protein